jgi:catechol 2,3-dioxygenase-like lactoylglutathione lyase family enzyme
VATTEFLDATPAFAVSDVQRGVAFFTDVLGFTAVVADESFALLRRDRVALSLWLADGSAPGAERELAGTVSCSIRVTDLDGWFEHCTAAGCVHSNGPLTRTDWGTREFHVLDPDHNLITFWQPVGDEAESR